jgi:uncharacterized protein YukE
METRTHKSPARKLVRFFESSRDKWTQKYLELQRARKRLSNQVRAVEKKRSKAKAASPA